MRLKEDEVFVDESFVTSVLLSFAHHSRYRVRNKMFLSDFLVNCNKTMISCWTVDTFSLTSKLNLLLRIIV